MSVLMKSTLGILLAGGVGERLFPLTRHRAKPAVPFGGNYRIVDVTLSNCINSGIRKLFIFTQYKSLSLNRHIRNGWYNVVAKDLDEFIEEITYKETRKYVKKVLKSYWQYRTVYGLPVEGY